MVVRLAEMANEREREPAPQPTGAAVFCGGRQLGLDRDYSLTLTRESDG